MATFSGRGDGTGVKNPRLKSPFPDTEPRFGGAFFVTGVAQNDLKQTDLIRFGLKGIQ